jgi:hypothetical protein
VTDIAACREYTLNLDLQPLPILEELGKDDADDFDLLGPLGWAAIYYARAGIPVFPLQPGTKIPLARSRGVLDASTDSRVIRSWWKRCPIYNIGVACGVGFDVLDIDVKTTAQGWSRSTTAVRWPTPRSLGQSLHAQRRYPSTLGSQRCRQQQPRRREARTGLQRQGRLHRRCPVDHHAREDRWESVEPDRRGATFNWAGARQALALAPKVVSHQRSTTSGGKADGLIRTVREAPKGNRNNAPYWAARSAVDDRLDPGILREAARAAGLPDRDISSTLGSATRAGAT